MGTDTTANTTDIVVRFTLHSGQMGTGRGDQGFTCADRFTLHSGQMGTLCPALSRSNPGKFTLHSGQMGTRALNYFGSYWFRSHSTQVRWGRRV